MASKRVEGFTLTGESIGVFESARLAAKKLGVDSSVVRKAASGAIKTAGNHTWKYIEPSTDVSTSTGTDSNDYGDQFTFSAVSPEGRFMSIDEYCQFYGLPRESITSYKAVTHTSVPYYNIVFKEKVSDGLNDFQVEEIKDILLKSIKSKYTYKTLPHHREVEGVLKIADLHFGAHIRDLVISPDYDSNILREGLTTSATSVNDMGFKKVHVHIQGDLIESFSGLNHVNSWMSMNPKQIGASAVKLCTEELHKFLKSIKNLGTVKIVGGNHDRTSKNNDEDVKGQAAELIAWGLELMGYDVEFHSYIITHKVGGINHICLHGDKGISKKPTQDILWKYGEKGVYNFITEAHLHTIIEKLSISERSRFKVIRDDQIDHRRMHLASFFTGNYYSETLGYTTNPGYAIIWEKLQNKPEVYQGSL